MMRSLAILGFGLAVVATTTAVRADNGPVIVVPGRMNAPIVINGRDASWAVVEGDWGLHRPGHMAPNVIGGSLLAPWRATPRQGGYHPAYGTRPERGRREIEPPADRQLPEMAESFSRSWGTHSETDSGDQTPRNRPSSFNAGADVPATIADPQPFNPPIIIAPQFGRRRP